MSDQFPMSSTYARAGAVVDAGLRAHMQRVYNRMTAGLFVTFLVAFIASNAPVVSAFVTNPMVAMVLAFSPLAVIWFGFNPMTMNSSKLRASFMLLSVLYGLSFTAIFMVYVPADIARALFITTIMFAGLSIFAYTTKTDLKPVGVFCMMGMFGLLALTVVSMLGSAFGAFEISSGFTTLISIASIVIFAGLTAWETQATKEMYHPGNGEEGNSRMAWAAALNLYISFIAMFQSILQLLGNRE